MSPESKHNKCTDKSIGLMLYLPRTRMARFTVDWAFVAIISTWRWAEMLLVGMRARTQPITEAAATPSRMTTSGNSTNPLVSLSSKHSQILFKFTHSGEEDRSYFLHYLILYHLGRLWKEWCWWQNSRSTWHLDWAFPVPLPLWHQMSGTLDRYLLQFYLGRSQNQEVSWYHLNQISNPTVRTIKVTGLENLYRKDDKYVSKGNVLFNLWYIFISIDRHSTHLSAKSLSSYHDGDCKIAVNWLLDINERDAVSIWAHGLEW